MGIAFPQYVSVKDKYCCLYLGDSPEYVLALKLVRPQINKHFPQIKFFISCKDDLMYLLEGENYIVSFTELTERRSDFSYIREIRNSYDKHSILEFIEESFELQPVCKNIEDKKGVCLICPEGLPPVKPMSIETIEKLKKKALSEGNIPMVLGSDIHNTLSNIKLRPNKKDKFGYISEAKTVIGVENEYTILAASQGKKVYLDRNGLGVTLYRKMFPKIELI